MGGRASELVVGVDGCPGGWAVVGARVVRGARGPHPQLVAIDVSFASGLERLIGEARAGRVAAVAIDMPIGLLDTHPRPADVAARKLLGPRRSSIFPTPLRVTLDAEDHADACARSRERCGKALSVQAWNLTPKIRELDRLILPTDQDRIVEAHPECAFARLNDGPVDGPKSTPAGRELRRNLLADVYGDDEIAGALSIGAAPNVDVLDAAVLTVTAARLVLGSAVRLGGDRDARGLRAEIVY